MTKTKAFLFCSVMMALLLFIAAGCNHTNDDTEYENRKRECKLCVQNNLAVVDSIINDLEKFNFGVDLYCNKGVLEVYGQASEEERMEILNDDTLRNNILLLFENDCIDAVSKTYYRNPDRYTYSIRFSDFKRGYTCVAVLVKDDSYLSDAHENIVGDWFYFEGQNE